MHVPAFDRAAQGPPRRNQPFLADDFIERTRAHALGQRHRGTDGGKQFRGWRFAAAYHVPIMPDAMGAAKLSAVGTLRQHRPCRR